MKMQIPSLTLDEQVVHLISEIKHRLKAGADKHPIGRALSFTLSGFIRTHGLDGDPHEYATLPSVGTAAKAVSVRDDIEIRRVPDEDVHQGRCVALAYSSNFGGAGIYLTPQDAHRLGKALHDTALEAELQQQRRAEKDSTPQQEEGEHTQVGKNQVDGGGHTRPETRSPVPAATTSPGRKAGPAVVPKREFVILGIEGELLAFAPTEDAAWEKWLTEVDPDELREVGLDHLKRQAIENGIIARPSQDEAICPECHEPVRFRPNQIIHGVRCACGVKLIDERDGESMYLTVAP